MKSITIALAAAALSFATAVWGQEEPMQEGEPRLVTGVGMSAEAGGGVGGFLDQRISDLTKVQGTWTARVVLGTRTHFAGEVGYIGAAQGLNTLGVDDNAYLLSNGLEGALRFNLLTGMWQPYAVAGVGWQHYSIQNSTANTSDFADKADVAEFPLGVGLAFRYAGFIADGRVSLHPAANSTLISNTPLSTWNAQAKIGFEF